MKHVIRSLALILALCLLLPTVSAFADGENATQRGLEKLKTTRNWNCIVLPQEGSWLEEWKTLYARKAWYAPNLFVETMPQTKSGIPPQGFVCEGTEVTVVAEENDMSCIVYRDDSYKLHTGWIQSVRLLDEFPGPTYIIGAGREDDFDVQHETSLSWSGDWLPGTEQQYTVLDEKLQNCVGFTFEYQLIAENTSNKSMVFGPRTLWVSDGENWTPLGLFPYEENGTVHVQVWLSEPMDLAAIATYAHCHAPNMFDFRQTAMDFLFEK